MYRDHNRFERRGMKQGSRKWTASVHSVCADTQPHVPEPGCTGRLEDIAIKLNMSSVMLGMCLDCLGLREAFRSERGNIYYVPSAAAIEKGIAQTGYKDGVGPWVDWDVNAVLAAVGGMAPEEREKAKGNHILKEQKKVFEKQEAAIKRCKEQGTTHAKWKEPRRKKEARRLLHKKVCRLLDAGLDRNQIAVAIDRGNNPNVVDMIARKHLLGQSGGCTCGYDHKAPHQSGKMVERELILS